MAASPAQRVAVLSLHTSPLAQPGVGDGGGMNVSERELTSSLARLGVECTTGGDRAESSTRPCARR
ncbi:MAG: glycosyltransferase MshA [Actinomycetota bacterium]